MVGKVYLVFSYVLVLSFLCSTFWLYRICILFFVSISITCCFGLVRAIYAQALSHTHTHKYKFPNPLELLTKKTGVLRHFERSIKLSLPAMC